MAYTCIMMNTRRGSPLGSFGGTNTKRGDAIFKGAQDVLNAAGTHGSNPEGWTVINDEVSNEYLHRACAAVVVATTGAASVVVNGTSVAYSFTTDLATTVAAAATAINADATAKRFVRALTRIGKLTTATAIAGNTVTICGVTFTAVNAAATAGTEQWDIRTSDTAAANSLATQINSHPVLANKVAAVSTGTSGVVYVMLLEDRAARSDETLVSGAATVTINNAIGTGVGLGLVAHAPGLMGTACSLTVTGTGASAATGNTSKLYGGTGIEGVAEVVESTYR